MTISTVSTQTSTSTTATPGTAPAMVIGGGAKVAGLIQVGIRLGDWEKFNAQLVYMLVAQKMTVSADYIIQAGDILAATPNFSNGSVGLTSAAPGTAPAMVIGGGAKVAGLIQVGIKLGEWEKYNAQLVYMLVAQKVTVGPEYVIQAGDILAATPNFSNGSVAAAPGTAPAMVIGGGAKVAGLIQVGIKLGEWEKYNAQLVYMLVAQKVTVGPDYVIQAGDILAATPNFSNGGLFSKVRLFINYYL